MRVVAADRMIVAARNTAMAHGGKCAGTAAGGRGGGTGASEGAGGRGVASAAGARPIAATRRTASPLSLASVRRVNGARRCCGGADGWFIGVAPPAVWAGVSFDDLSGCPH